MFAFYVLALVFAPVLLVVEWLLARRRGLRIHDPRETADSLAQLVGEAVLNLALGLDMFAAYGFVARRIGVVEWSARSVVTWLVAFVALDFVYYWGHRACHRVAPLWALHAVHHQPREMNLSVGLRGPMLAVLQTAPFLVPLAVLGVPVEVMLPVYVVHTAYKLAVHTRLVGTLGWLEKWLVTPSQHRVHHARNERFRDKNFGGVFAIWDRAFGTYQREDEAVVTGQPIRFAPLANNLGPWTEFSRQLGRDRSSTPCLSAATKAPSARRASLRSSRASTSARSSG